MGRRECGAESVGSDAPNAVALAQEVLTADPPLRPASGFTQPRAGSWSGWSSFEVRPMPVVGESVVIARSPLADPIVERAQARTVRANLETLAELLTKDSQA